jgi:hypothetical protein
VSCAAGTNVLAVNGFVGPMAETKRAIQGLRRPLRPDLPPAQLCLVWRAAFNPEFVWRLCTPRIPHTLGAGIDALQYVAIPYRTPYLISACSGAAYLVNRSKASSPQISPSLRKRSTSIDPSPKNSTSRATTDISARQSRLGLAGGVPCLTHQPRAAVW